MQFKKKRQCEFLDLINSVVSSKPNSMKSHTCAHIHTSTYMVSMGTFFLPFVNIHSNTSSAVKPVSNIFADPVILHCSWINSVEFSDSL